MFPDLAAIQIMLIFLPGLVAMTIVRHLALPANYPIPYFVLYSFLLGLLSYAALDLIGNGIVWTVELFGGSIAWSNSWDSVSGVRTPDFITLACATTIAIIFALALAYSIESKWLTDFGLRAGIGNRFGDIDVLTHTLHHYTGSGDTSWVYVRDQKADLCYFGDVRNVSYPNENPEILLKDVTVIRNSTSEELYECAFVYLNLSRGEFSIESYLKPESTDAKRQIQQGQ